MQDTSRDKTLKTISYLKTGDTSEFKNEEAAQPSRTKRAISAIREKGFAGVKTAKDQLDEYLGEKVQAAGEKGELAGNAAALGATAVSTAADMLIPESAGEAAMAVLPGGRAVSKLKMPAKKALKAGEEVVENALDYSGKALKPTSTKTGATKGWQSPKNTGIADTDKFIQQQAVVIEGIPDSVWRNWDISTEHAAKIKEAVMKDPTLLYKAQDANSGQINLSRLGNLIK